MTPTKKRGYCPECDRNVMAEREAGISDGWGCLLTILTGGLFFPLWVLLWILNAQNTYDCPICGLPTQSQKQGPPPVPRDRR